ncbi:NACHT, LRR and PYD domains-containing protein 9A-like isoform X1 [Notamacropus eugenii]|uniref:NACHT, LRR and PYD domains-containing protein 9A-like isoform X1 n=1 Tax=Notamacropus eugenii TaxID=9315 RepID=UPI003B6759C6
MKLPCETLGKKKCQLETLETTYSKKGSANVLESFLPERRKNLALNVIRLEGVMKLLCGVLAKQDCKLQTLSLMECHLNHTCSQNLFSALSSNESLKELDLRRNALVEGEIKLMCKALENQNCKLETLSLMDCHLNRTCSQNLFSALISNKSLKDLDLSGNSLEESGIKLLCQALGNPNCKLGTLRLSRCALTTACLQELLPVICSSENLKTLDLSFNLFGDEGMKLMCEALEKQDCKLQTLFFSQPAGFSEESRRALTNLKSRKSFPLILEKYPAVSNLSMGC